MKMALSKTYELKLQYENNRVMYDNDYLKNISGIEPIIEKTFIIESTYIVVSRFEGNKERLTFYISIYDNSLKENLITSTPYEFVPSVEDEAGNFIKQAYEYLKTLPEFENAIDILEEGQAA